MSIFEAISIQGIRSFDPNKAQILEFLRPVTIILGQNGSGKTTIIESLKYATTGDFPPGSKLGGSFVHDPKIAQESETKAKISLEIKDLKGNSLSVSRSLKATQKDKNKQVSQQTLDSSIKRTLVNGETSSISSKCADINLEMTNSLGVSKAVLENVIFCHQEESNWPLMEGSSVKQRFDNLFASTRYVKALESIFKTRKEKDADIKQYKIELKFLKVDRDEADKKLSNKKVLESKVGDSEVKIKEIQEKLKPTESSVLDYQIKISQLNQVEMDLNAKISEKAANEKRILELNKNIPEPLNYSVDELNIMINDSGRDLERMKVEITNIEIQISELKSENVKASIKNNTLLVEKGGINTKIEANRNRKEGYTKQLEQICSQHSIEYNHSSATRTIKYFQDYINKEEENFKEEMEKIDLEIKNKQKLLDNKMAEKSKLEHDIEMNKSSLRQKQLELKNIDKRITDIGEDSQKLNVIEIDLSSLKEELTTFRNNFNSNELKEKISNDCSYISVHEDKLNEIDKELTSILKFDVKFNEINSLKQQISDKSNEAKRLRNRHLESLNTVFNNNIPQCNIKKFLNEKLSQWRIEGQKYQSSLISYQSNLASLTVEDKQLRIKIDEKLNLVKKFEENIFKICGNYEFEEYLLKLKKKKVDLEEEINTVQGNVSLYKKFQKILITSGSDCPLCHREFCNESESANLLEEINEKINFAPDLDKKSNDLISINSEFEELLKLQSQSQEIIHLKDSILSKLELEAQTKRNDMCKAKSLIDQISSDQESCKGLEFIANKIQIDVALMEKLTEDVEELKKNLNNLEQQITMTWNEFQNKVVELRSQKSSMQNELFSKKKSLDEERNNYDKLMNIENDLSMKLNKLERKKLDIQSGQQEWSSLQTKKDDLKSEVDSLEAKIQSSKSNLEPIIYEVLSLKKNLESYKNKSKLTENESNKKINNLNIQLRELETMSSDIKRFEKDNYQEKFIDIENKISKNNYDIKINNESISEMEDTIETYRSSISNNKIKNREMIDTITIRHCQDDIQQLNVTIQTLENNLGGTNLKQIQRELTKLENDRYKLKEEFESALFQKNQSVNEINYIEQEIRERYFDAEPKYLSMLCKMKVVEIAVADLDKYYKALDQAIMSHHRSKMAEINKILKELWRNTYSGKDIDFVEICCDEESSNTGAKKRTYNYRVVMVKSGVRLDMRGRCSAGQKVLACLLIRLALAEVFCLHCGVLSLDEPTTNLDQENIENLAYALVKIIKNRSKQKNFQLILITHDEEFLQLLSRSDYVDEFYKIHCNTNGHSEIHKTRIDHR